MIYYDNLIQPFDFQVFRSIDSGSVKGFPKYEDEAEAQVSKTSYSMKVLFISDCHHMNCTT